MSVEFLLFPFPTKAYFFQSNFSFRQAYWTRNKFF